MCVPGSCQSHPHRKGWTTCQPAASRKQVPGQTKPQESGERWAPRVTPRPAQLEENLLDPELTGTPWWWCSWIAGGWVWTSLRVRKKLLRAADLREPHTLLGLTSRNPTVKNQEIATLVSSQRMSTNWSMPRAVHLILWSLAWGQPPGLPVSPKEQNSSGTPVRATVQVHRPDESCKQQTVFQEAS